MAESMEVLLDPSSVGSRHRRSFSLAEKMKIIDRMAQGQSATKIARDYNVNESTIRHMRKQEATIRLAANSMTSQVASGSKRNRNLQMSKMEACLTTWLDDIHAKRLPAWHSKIKTKALQLYDLIGKHELFESVVFAASTGWFERFKRKYDLFELRPHEDRPPPSEVEFKATMKSAIGEGHITTSQLFTVETSMFHWKLLPGMESQDKAMMILSFDASGKFITPPILYRQKEEPVDSSTYVKLAKPEFISKQDVRDWFYDIFVPMAEDFLKSSGLTDRAIVLLANDPNHPSDLEHYSFDVATVPPGCNSTCLPTARGILLHLNAVYLKQLSLALRDVVSRGHSLEEAWRRFSIEDTTTILKATLENLDKRALKNGWSYLLDSPRYDFSNDNILQEAATILQKIGLNNITMKQLREQITPRELSNEEIVEHYMKHQKEHESSNLGELAQDSHISAAQLDPVERRMLVNEINQHLAALAAARKFFETKDKNKPRAEAISKRLKQVSIWMREMRAEITPTDTDDRIPLDIKIEPLEIVMEMESDE